MTTNKDLKKLRLFAASPSDVATERARLETVVGLLKPLADHIGLSVDVVDWRKVVPDMGRPQQVIFDQLQPTTWDVFIGILWHRFGAPPGGKDPQTQKEYLSGTEEEFKTAFRLWEQFQKPRIMMYRCTRQVDLTVVDFDQARKVQEFFAQFDAMKGQHPGLYQSFDTAEAFEKLLWDNLLKILLKYSEEETGQVISPQTVEAIVSRRNPDTLPPRAAFFGRDKEMQRVLYALSPEERGWGVVIDGIGGIGKTALAVEAAYRCKEQNRFEAFIFVSAKQNRLEPSGIKALSPAAVTLDEFVNETARALGQSGIAKLDGETKRKTLLDALVTCRALLIYDNLETLTKGEQEALADFLRFLPQSCKAILTSRRQGGEGALWQRLEKLDWQDSYKIIIHEIERDINLKAKLQLVETRWQELHDATGGSPLALINTLGLMRVKVTLGFDDALSLLLRGAESKSDLQKFIYEEASKELGPNDTVVLNALSFFVPSASFEALITVTELKHTVLGVVLERLNALALVNILAGEERYTLHPLTRTYIRETLSADAANEYSVGRRFASHWVDYAKKYGGGGNESYKTYNRLESEWPNLEATAIWLWKKASVKTNIIANKEAGQMLNGLANALSQFLLYYGRWDERVRICAWGYEAAQALHDLHEAGWRATEVMWIPYMRGRQNDATLWTDRCAEMWAGSEDKYKKATVKRMYGLMAQDRRNYSEAERFFQEALAIWRDLGYKSSVAMALNNLGYLSRYHNDYDVAEKYHLEALEVALKSGDKESQSIYYSALGILSFDRKQSAKANQWLEQALSLAKEIGRLDLIAGVQHNLALVREAEGRLEPALLLAQEALATRKQLQHESLTATQNLVKRLTAAVQNDAT